MSSEGPSALDVFQGVVSIILRDGVLSQDEKRLVIKLASLLGLEADEPKRVYEAVLSGNSVEGGRPLSREEALEVYEELFRTAFMNTTISEDEFYVVAYVRHTCGITEDEHEAVVSKLEIDLVEHVDKKVVERVKDQMKHTVDRVSGIFDSIAQILPEGGR